MGYSKQVFFRKSFLSKEIQYMLKKHALASAVLIGLNSSIMYSAHAELDPNFAESAVDEKKLEQLEDLEEAKRLEEQRDLQLQFDSLDQRIKTFEADAAYQYQNAEIAEIDEGMVAEIYRIAEQAQQEASNQSNQLLDQTSLEQIEQNIISNNQMMQSNVEQSTLVDQLMATIDKDPIDLPVITKEKVINEEGTQQLATTNPPKRTWLDKLLGREAVDKDAVPEKLPTIRMTITGIGSEDKVLENNIEAILSNFTVEAFRDFNAALPQIRNMTQQAAQAVGYYDTKMSFVQESPTALRVNVIPNDPVIVNKPVIEITGDGAVRPAFRVIPVVPDLREGDVLNHGKYETLKARISNAANDLGYFDGYWRMHDLRVNVPENTADIQLKYETQKRYTLEDVQFKMVGSRKEFPLRPEVLQQLVPFKDGDEYGSWRINTLTSNLTNSRYFNYTLVNVIKPDPVEKELELPDDLAALEKQQKLLEQQEKAQAEHQHEITEQDVVEEQIFVGAADARSVVPETKVADETEQLKRQARENQKIPVIVSLNADQLNNVEAGIGYGTDTGVRLRTQYRRAIVNDRGHSFDANIELSQIRQSFDARYMIPYKHPLNDYISLVGGYEREDRDQIGQGVELAIESAVFGAERVIKRPLGNWQHNMMVRYRLDRITDNGIADYDEIPDAFKIITSSPEQESLLFGYEISKVNQNNRVNPTIGFRQFYRAEVGSESLLTETDMAILNAGWRFIYSLGTNANHQFVGRADIGYIVTDNFDKVPYNLRYFAGGDQSIRGFDYKSLSPKEDDLLLGGQAMAVGSLEYNYQFKPGWRGAIFADVGNAYDEKFNNETKYGVGVGVRWASPVGPIRIDVGAGISEESVPIRLHFFIGPSL